MTASVIAQRLAALLEEIEGRSRHLGDGLREYQQLQNARPLVAQAIEALTAKPGRE